MSIVAPGTVRMLLGEPHEWGFKGCWRRLFGQSTGESDMRSTMLVGVAGTDCVVCTLRVANGKATKTTD